MSRKLLEAAESPGWVTPPPCCCWCRRAVARARGCSAAPWPSVLWALCSDTAGVQGAVSFIRVHSRPGAPLTLRGSHERARSLRGRRSPAGGRPVSLLALGPALLPAECLALLRQVPVARPPCALGTLTASTSWLRPAPHLMSHGYPCLVVPLEGAVCPGPGLLGSSFPDSKEADPEWTIRRSSQSRPAISVV